MLVMLHHICFIKISSSGTVSCNKAGFFWSVIVQKIELGFTYLADVSALGTFDLFDQLEPHLLINRNIRVAFGTFQVTRHTFLIGLLHDTFHQAFPYTHSTGQGTDTHHVAEVITARVCPEGVMCILLHLLPDPVSRNVQAAPAQETNIIQELSE